VEVLRKQVPHRESCNDEGSRNFALSACIAKFAALFCTNKCGPGQPPEPHRFVEFLRCLVTAGRRNDAFGPTALLRAPHLPKAQLPVRDLAISNCNLCGGQRPFLLKEQGGGGGRNARATSPRVVRFQLVPRRFTLVNHRLPLALPQSSSKFRNTHVFGESTFSQIVAARNRKTLHTCEQPVDEETSLWKVEENSARNFLDAVSPIPVRSLRSPGKT
jgi:hypothetical protein